MFSIEGVCDWCKKRDLLTKHEYFDGKTYYSCEKCNSFAAMDVRQFNIAEQAHLNKQRLQLCQ